MQEVLALKSWCILVDIRTYKNVYIMLIYYQYIIIIIIIISTTTTTMNDVYFVFRQRIYVYTRWYMHIPYIIYIYRYVCMCVVVHDVHILRSIFCSSLLLLLLCFFRFGFGFFCTSFIRFAYEKKQYNANCEYIIFPACAGTPLC